MMDGGGDINWSNRVNWRDFNHRLHYGPQAEGFSRFPPKCPDDIHNHSLSETAGGFSTNPDTKNLSYRCTDAPLMLLYTSTFSCPGARTLVRIARDRFRDRHIYMTYSYDVIHTRIILDGRVIAAALPETKQAAARARGDEGKAHF